MPRFLKCATHTTIESCAASLLNYLMKYPRPHPPTHTHAISICIQSFQIQKGNDATTTLILYKLFKVIKFIGNVLCRFGNLLLIVHRHYKSHYTVTGSQLWLDDLLMGSLVKMIDRWISSSSYLLVTYLSFHVVICRGHDLYLNVQLLKKIDVCLLQNYEVIPFIHIQVTVFLAHFTFITRYQPIYDSVQQ